MATSVYFNNFQSSQEQTLIEDLIIESIKIYGHDLFYMPRTRTNMDKIYGEATLSEFNEAILVDMYIKSVDGFDGDGDFITKFGLEIRDRVTFSIARRTFSAEVGNILTEAVIRPREGDLIYFPLNKKIFEIKFVEHESIFYQMGALQMYDLTCELFEYSDEKFATGNPDIDDLYTQNPVTGINYSESLSNYALLTEEYNPRMLLTEDGFMILNESYTDETMFGDNLTIQEETDGFVDFSEMDPFSEGTY